MIIRITFTLLLCILCSFSASSQVVVKEDIAKEVLEIVNKYRVSKRMRKLAPKRQLTAIALKHAKNMASGRIPFSHDGFDNRVHAVKQYAKVHYRVSENLYADYERVGLVRTSLKQWLKSPGHKKNIHGDFLFTGVAVVQSKQGEYFIVQLFVGKY